MKKEISVKHLSGNQPPATTPEHPAMQETSNGPLHLSPKVRSIVCGLAVSLLLSLIEVGVGPPRALAFSQHLAQNHQPTISTPQLIFAQAANAVARLYALHSDTGAVAWTYANSAVTNHTNAVNGRLILSGSGTLMALNAVNGQVIWTVRGPSFSTPATNEDASGMMYIGGNGGIYAYHASTGQLAWYSNPHPAGSVAFFLTELIVANGIIYGGANDGIYALDKLTGRKIWGNTSLVWIANTAYSNGLYYVVPSVKNSDGDYRPSNILYAFSASTGAFVWSFRASESIPTGIRAVNGLVYFITADSQVYAIKESSPSLVWRTPLPYGPNTPNALTGGNVYVGTTFGGLYSLAWDTGRILWHYADSVTAASHTPRPTIAGLVYVGYEGGYVYAFDPSAARYVWRAYFEPYMTTPITVWW